MECRLKHSSKPWNCQIRLRRKRDTDLDGQHRSGLDAESKTNVRAREETFGPLITNKSELELMIRRAQLAILNPTVPVARFVEMSEQELESGFAGNDGQLQFSQDVVCLTSLGRTSRTCRSSICQVSCSYLLLNVLRSLISYFLRYHLL